MLPELISNITLAGIAIGIIYMLVPMFKTKKTNKKNYSRSEFDSLVQRKVNQMSQGSSSSPLSEDIKTSKSQRSELDYLDENNMFLSQEDKLAIFSIKKEIQWGTGENIQSIMDSFLDLTGYSIDTTKLTTLLRKTMNKKFFLDTFKKKNISFLLYRSYIINYILLDDVKSEDKNTLKALSKKFLVKPKNINLLICLLLEQDDKEESIILLSRYIQSLKIKISQDQFDNFIKRDQIILTKKLINHIKTKIDIIVSLEDLDNNQVIKRFGDINDKDLTKKKYKKLVALFHPDKWTFFEKNEEINERLNKNFNLIKSYYEEIG